MFYLSSLAAIFAWPAVQLDAALRDLGRNLPRYTGFSTDLAINGEGFFIVTDSVTVEKFATRWGNFRVDAAGRLVTVQGFRLQTFAFSKRRKVRHFTKQLN